MYKAEMTDTFGGEANYCWVRRAEMPEAKTILAAVRQAKKAFDIVGARCRRSDYGDEVRLDIVGACIVVFVRWEDTPAD